MGNKMADDPNNEKALHGIKVLDLTRFLSGPQTTLFLAALGQKLLKLMTPNWVILSQIHHHFLARMVCQCHKIQRPTWASRT